MKILGYALRKKHLMLLLLLLATALCRPTDACGEEFRVTFSARRLTASEIIRQVERNTEYVFAYNNSIFDASRSVLLPAVSLTVTEAVEAMLKDSGFTYTVNNKHISILRAPEKAKPPVRQTASALPEDLRYLTSVSGESPENALGRVKPLYDTIPVVKLREVEKIVPPDYRSEYTGVGSYMAGPVSLPKVALKTNLLYGIAAMAPNLAVEAGLNEQLSFEFFGSYNPWNRVGTVYDNKKLVHWILRPELRWWTCERFNGHFFGVHGFYWQFNISGHDIPLLGFKKDYRYEGNAFGAGVAYGYHLMLNRRFGLEFSVGAGVAFMKYEKSSYVLCSDAIGRYNTTYAGITKMAVSLIYIIK